MSQNLRKKKINKKDYPFKPFLKSLCQSLKDINKCFSSINSTKKYILLLFSFTLIINIIPELDFTIFKQDLNLKKSTLKFNKTREKNG